MVEGGCTSVRHQGCASLMARTNQYAVLLANGCQHQMHRVQRHETVAQSLGSGRLRCLTTSDRGACQGHRCTDGLADSRDMQT